MLVRVVALALTVVLATSPNGNAAEPASGSAATSSAAQQELQQLVIQLGADDFLLREQAQEKLLARGSAALPQLRSAAGSFDPEVRFRAQRLLSQIAESDFEQRLEALAADSDPDADHGLPWWREFRDAYGHDKPARELFVAMQRVEGSFLRQVAELPLQSGSLLVERCRVVQQLSQQQAQPLPLGTIAALLAVAGREREQAPEQAVQLLFHFCHQPSFERAMETPPQRRLFSQMLGGLMHVRENAWSAYYVIELALRYDLRQGLKPAVAALAQTNSQTHVRVLALAAVAELGDRSHTKLVERYLNDFTLCGSHVIDNQIHHQKVCDVALAALAHLHGLELADVGLPQSQPTDYYPFDINSVGFAGDAQRRKALEQWPKLRDGAQGPAQ